ncbi:MAG: class A beta-lactamase [Xanthobacteraceae bacterium]|nr:class A beta-lactamase [Xanthobacteraceae bacterium]
MVTGVAATVATLGLLQAKTVNAAAPFLTEELTRIESGSGGRLGVAILDTGTQRHAEHRAAELFPMCSTFKLLASAAVLKRCDNGQDQLQRRIKFQASDLVTYSPVTKDHVGGDGMTLAELCAAALNYSDNTAANLLLASLGGPQALTAYARSIGDPVTRLDRIEPDLNEAVPGDPRDTTTPAAMLQNLHTLLFGEVLSAASKDQLTVWLLGNRTGDARLRAALPPGWRCGDKTGSGERGSTNDIGVIWPPQGAPIVVTVYLTETAAASEARNATLADVGRAIVRAFAA